MKTALISLFLVGCSGAVTDPSTKPVPAPLAVTPAALTAYPGIPSTFTASGGTGTYTVASSNQAVVPNPTVSGGAFTILPASVTAETKLDLAVQDGASTITVPVTVEPLATVKLTAVPGSIAFQGQTPTTCASAIPADILVYGGSPPYVATQPPGYTVTPSLLTVSPGRFTVVPTGQCVPETQLAIADLTSSVTVKLTNVVSPTPIPTVPSLTVAPNAVTLSFCGDVAHVAVITGSGSYFAASGSSAVTARIFGNEAEIFRAHSPTPFTTTTVPVVISDGITTQVVTVTLASGAQGAC